jgi:formylglycine-generating enzyme required for sulfatase activity
LHKKNEEPPHAVTIANTFAVSKYEVTFGEWDACFEAGACPAASDRWGRGALPAINVSWKGAKQYVAWLSRITGKEYRLLSEAEWEYAARAGSVSAYSWGDEIGTGNANCKACGSQWDGRQTAPVGKFKPNSFGLYDMHGNVREWVEDVFHDSYNGAPANGFAWEKDENPLWRVYRGGAWWNEPQTLRSASRDGELTEYISADVGFRIARTLKPSR